MMLMPTINLMPWREARQLRRRSVFCLLLSVTVCLTFAVVAGAAQLAASTVSLQEQANNLARAEIAALQQRISEQEVAFAEGQKQQADFAYTRAIHAARMKQSRLLAELPHLVAAGVTLDRLRYDPPEVQLQGSAESAQQVSRWLALLDVHADISTTELQALYVDDAGESSDKGQVYYYRLVIELKMAAIGHLSNPPGVPPDSEESP